MASLQHAWLYAKNPTLSPYPTTLKPSAASKPFKVSLSRPDSSSSNCWTSPKPLSASFSANSPEPLQELEPDRADPVKLALERAKTYKKSKAEQEQEKKRSDESNTDEEVPVSVKIAMQKAKEYRKSKGIFFGGVDNAEDFERNGFLSSTEQNNVNPRSEFVDQNETKKQELKISNIDFVGLNFADKKKSRGLPPGLVPISDPFPQGDLPEVEIIVGDTAKFDDATATSESEQVIEDTSNVYKPKVSTWGVFPRPSNISKTFGGGRNIRPGDLLETSEERDAKEERTRRLLAAYKEKVGLNIDPKLKSEYEKVLKDGNFLMDVGRLKEALPYYEKVMDKMVFQSELHGLAALQWSICQDSLRRVNEARVMYEKLQSHPNANVSKKARQFMFSFQAMEMLKVSSSSLSATNTGYQNYFEAFVEDKTNYTSERIELGDGVLNQTLPYVIFLVSPILLVLIIAVQRASVH